MRKWVVVAVILLVIGLIGIGTTISKDRALDFGTVEINQHGQTSGAGVNNIILKASSADVTVIKGTGNEIKASLTGKVSKRYEEQTKLYVIQDGATVKVGVALKRGFTFGINIIATELTLELPEQQYNTLSIDTGSGNTNIAVIDTKALDIKTGSGDVNLKQLNSSKISLNLGSGNIEVFDSSADSTVIEDGSGNIKFEKMKSDSLSVKTGSGNIKLTDVEGKLKAHASSGNIYAELSTIRFPMDLSTGSGNVTVLFLTNPILCISNIVQDQAVSGTIGTEVQNRSQAIVCMMLRSVMVEYWLKLIQAPVICR